jgi:hypothetical protein
MKPNFRRNIQTRGEPQMKRGSIGEHTPISTNDQMTNILTEHDAQDKGYLVDNESKSIFITDNNYQHEEPSVTDL